ncbi:uncharacterized protein IL334_005626 [Kwoniella shivajii]|uniref:HMG box domain-containing protein n=1 Tax=Kwoniella shivajii TaxID=564305 RepID=A0ABZ1D3N3_9TREE|nr:hypothetical protein IL334_005626 [Kwoniella shivajii]
METNPWTVDGFVGTPDMIENNESNDFFQVVPPTPKSHQYIQQQSYTNPQSGNTYSHPALQQHQQLQQQQVNYDQQMNYQNHNRQSNSNTHAHANAHANAHAHAHQLRSSVSEISLRSHRSASSTSSSHLSGYAWSTVPSDDNFTTSEIDEPENENENENEDQTQFQNYALSASSNPFIGGNGIAQNHLNHSQGNIQQHSRVPSLSIDPKLFHQKRNSIAISINDNNNNNNNNNIHEDGIEDDNGDDDENDMDMLETAKPQSQSRSQSQSQSQSQTSKGKYKNKKNDIIGEKPSLPIPSNFGLGNQSEVTKPKSKKERVKKMDKEGKKVSHARKQTADHIPRPRNAFILFRKHVVDSKLIPASVEMRHQNVSIITAKMWSEAPPDQKAQFNDLARIEKEEHLKKYPGYRYQPVYRRTNVIRRRVRKDEAEEQKCKSVAELLIKGKSGEALENEIKEKIRRGSDVSPESTKERSASRRSSVAACELSKGALRALRAQARQQYSESGDWSDISRSSVDPEMKVETQIQTRRSRSRRQSYINNSRSSSRDNSLEPVQQPIMGFGLAPSQIQGFAQSQSQSQSQSQFQSQFQSQTQPQDAFWDGMEYASMSGFTFNHDNCQHAIESEQLHYPQQSVQHHQQQQEYSFPPDISIPTQDQIHHRGQTQFQPSHQPNTSSFSSTSQSFSDPSSSHSFLYPQPGFAIHMQSQGNGNLTDNITNVNENEFYTYDTALPFSPSAGTFTFPPDANNGNTANPQSGDGTHTGDYAFALPDLEENNHNDIQHGDNDYRNDQYDRSIPFSPVKWDGNPLLPPSSGVPLEGLPFDDTLMLGDFEAALAHADEVGGW